MDFPALYPGKCAADCGWINPGDDVEWVDGHLVHVECMPEPEVERKPRPVCPECFTEIALNGACQCVS